MNVEITNLANFNDLYKEIAFLLIVNLGFFCSDWPSYLTRLHKVGVAKLTNYFFIARFFFTFLCQVVIRWNLCLRNSQSFNTIYLVIRQTQIFFRKSGEIICQIPQYLTIPLSGEKTEFWNFWRLKWVMKIQVFQRQIIPIDGIKQSS